MSSKFYLTPVDKLPRGIVYIAKSDFEHIFWYLKDSVYPTGLLVNPTKDEVLKYVTANSLFDEPKNLVLYTTHPSFKSLYTARLRISNNHLVFVLLKDNIKWMESLYKSLPSEKYRAIDLTKIDYTQDPLIKPLWDNMPRHEQMAVKELYTNYPKRLHTCVTSKMTAFNSRQSILEGIDDALLMLANKNPQCLYKLWDLPSFDILDLYTDVFSYPKIIPLLKQNYSLGDLNVYFTIALDRCGRSMYSNPGFFVSLFWKWVFTSTCIHSTSKFPGLRLKSDYKGKKVMSFDPSPKAINIFYDLFR